VGCCLQTTLTRFGGRAVLEVVDIAKSEAGPGQQFIDVPTAGVHYADSPATSRSPDATPTSASPYRANQPQSARADHHPLGRPDSLVQGPQRLVGFVQ
jgi:hypothetical protein